MDSFINALCLVQIHAPIDGPAHGQMLEKIVASKCFRTKAVAVLSPAQEWICRVLSRDSKVESVAGTFLAVLII